MNTFNALRTFLIRAAGCALASAAIAVGAWAQDTTVTTIEHGPSSFETKVRNAEVAYVEGNNLVLRTDDGRLEHMVVPDQDKFHVNGRKVSVYELRPGTKLTETIVTTTTPRYVNSVRTIEGKIWHVNAPKSLILTLPGHKQLAYTVPEHAKFTVDGKEKTVFDLRRGMNIKATIVTDEPQSLIEYSKTVTGRAPFVAQVPQQIGTLLILNGREVATATEASLEQPLEELPKTGSLVPLTGLLGSIGTVGSVGLTAVRKYLL